MRSKDQRDGLRALAIAGNHVVLLGWDMSEAELREKRVLGFAVQRRRESDGEVIWLKAMKTFESVLPHPERGRLVSMRKHPLQSFQWADYSVSPDSAYSYRIVARCGAPQALTDGPNVTLDVKTERIDRGKHAIFFNRGAAASQEYARRFQNQKPSDVGQAAFDWLSRGLIEGLEQYIASAGTGDELLGAFFEFKNQRIFQALDQARKRGATVKILYDADSQREGNEAAIAGSPVEDLVQPREHSAGFAHNKFLVHRRAGKSKAVWTGSTNLSENGIFGHSNNAHLVRDPSVAERYHLYFKRLEQDETRKPTAAANLQASPAPTTLEDNIVTVFSPRPDLDALDWYATLAGDAERALFATFAFGMNERFVQVYEKEDDVLRFALMEKKGNGKTFKQQAAEIDRIRKLRNTVISVGNRVALNNFDRWLEEVDRIVDEAHVLYIHTKYMLIDPLGPSPKLIIGSANFSKASTDTNDENMLVIEGDSGVADIYLGEFMRLFSHYAFRESLTFKQHAPDGLAPKPSFLVETVDWVNGGYFKPGSDRALRRKYFSGQ